MFSDQKTFIKTLQIKCFYAILSIPSTQNTKHSIKTDDDLNLKSKFAQIIGLEMNEKTFLSREFLLQQILTPELNKNTIFHNLEKVFDPLNISKNVEPILNELKTSEKSLSRYVNHLKNAFVLRIARQSSKVYDIMEISAFEDILPMKSKFKDIESLLLDDVCADNLFLRIDQKEKLIYFNEKTSKTHFSSVLMEQQKHFFDFTQKISVLAAKMEMFLDLEKNSFVLKREKMRQTLINHIQSNCEEDRQSVFEKIKLIETRKQMEEEQRLKDEKMEEMRQRELEVKRMENERVRLKKLSEQREKERLKKEQDDFRQKILNQQRNEIVKAEKEMATQEEVAKMAMRAAESSSVSKLTRHRVHVADSNVVGDKVKKLRELLKSTNVIDTQELAKAKHEADVERKKKMKELRIKERKRFDYFIRACRQREALLLKENWKTEQIELEKKQKEDWNTFKTDHKQRHTLLLEQKSRFVDLKPMIDEYLGDLTKDIESKINAQKLRKKKHDDRRVENLKYLEEMQKKKEEELLRKAEEEEKRKKQEEEEREIEAERKRKEEELELKKAKERLELEKAKKRASIFGTGSHINENKKIKDKMSQKSENRFSALNNTQTILESDSNKTQISKDLPNENNFESKKPEKYRPKFLNSLSKETNRTQNQTFRSSKFGKTSSHTLDRFGTSKKNISNSKKR